MKRLLVLLACLAGLAAALAFLRSEVSTDAVAARIAGVLVPFGDRKPDFQGDATVRLFPRLAVVFRAVRIAASSDATGDRPDLAADGITADIDVLPLFIGRTSVSRLVLEHPLLRMRTTVDLAGLTPARDLLTRMLPASVVVHNGEIRVQSPDGQREEALQSIEADLRWPRALGNLSLDGTASWRGETVVLSLQGIAPPRLASGEAGDLDLSLMAPSVRMSFAGKALLSDRLQLDGVFSAGADDPRRLSDLLSGSRPAGQGDDPSPSQTSAGALPPVAIAGHLRSQGWMGALSDAELKIGPVAADGVVSARFDLPRPQLRGTLAIGDVDLTPAFAAIKAQHWLDWSPDPATIAGLDIDLRLSIGEAVIGVTRLANLAASLLIAEGQIHAEVGDVSLLGGNGSVILHGDIDHMGMKAGGRFTLVGAPLTALQSLISVETMPSSSGAISLIGDFETAGGTLGAALSALHGRATLEAQRLVLDEFAASAARLAAAHSPLLQAASVQLRLDPELERLVCAMTFASADLMVQRLDFTLAGLKFGFAGRASLASRAIGLTGDARRDPSGTAAAAGEQSSPDAGRLATVVPIRVTGTLDHPIVAFDPDVPGAVPDPATTTGTVPSHPSAAN